LWNSDLATFREACHAPPSGKTVGFGLQQTPALFSAELDISTASTSYKSWHAPCIHLHDVGIFRRPPKANPAKAGGAKLPV